MAEPTYCRSPCNLECLSDQINQGTRSENSSIEHRTGSIYTNIVSRTRGSHKGHDAHVRLLSYGSTYSDIDDGFRTKLAEWSAYDAELRGLAIAIGDKNFLDIVNEGYSFYEKPLNERVFYQDEVIIRGRSQRLHTRISELLKDATK